MKTNTTNHVKVKVTRNPDWDEWVVKAWVNGKRRPAADYYTDDRDDAHDTAKAMVEDLTRVLKENAEYDELEAPR